MDYEKQLKEVNKLAPDFLKQFGYSNEEINHCFKEVENDTDKREKLIVELTKVGFEINLIKEDFPLRWYEVTYNDKQAIMNHDISPCVFFRDVDHRHLESYDPSVSNVIDAIKDYMNKFGMNVPMDKKI